MSTLHTAPRLAEFASNGEHKQRKKMASPLATVMPKDFNTLPSVRWVWVTPEYAEQLLDMNTRNRNLKRWWVDALAECMREGLYYLTGETVKVSRDHVILDGQNRLHAIVKSGCACMMLLVEGLPPEAGMAIDQGRPRTTPDASVWADGIEGITNQIAAVARKMMQSEGIPTRCKIRQLKFIEQHQDAILFAIRVTSPNQVGITSAPVRAAIAKAWYYEDEAILDQFGRVLTSMEMSTAEDRVVITLAKKLMQVPTGSETGRTEAYQRTEWAINKYVTGDGGTQKRCHRASSELYPIGK